ncbi:helix-turn-helix transcriptional regulator [Marvinbryantia formatexigens]|nr:helix-turn-helix transcriptional regulator [Marvinbryantia formatexigens]UWO23654.1 helix-turn-helix transcriptional regulator [Marvinbryantia formatexigens DSM 14469]SDF64683.1 Helix-turn-helix domain-containing protein [Marvinbryantia formatexigens]
MDIDKLELLRNVIDAYGVKLWILQDETEQTPEFDEGLRKQLYQNYDYSFLAEQIRKNCHPDNVYRVYDNFALHYLIFLMPPSGPEGRKYIIIGAYFMEQEKPDAVRIADEAKLELYQVQTLKEYYYGTTSAANIEHVVCSLLRMLYPEINWKIEKTGISLREPQTDGMRPRPQAEDELSMRMIEERYKCENEMLNALAQGDADKVEEKMSRLVKFRLETRSDSSLRDAKNNLVIMNVLFRKAVENAGVHPYYIDKLSSSLGKRIEAARNMIDIVSINREFVRRYCLLVRNYALQGYSPVITKCLNYIDFNLTEELTLNSLAERFSVNASALSKKFRSELGMTLTDYVNKKRVDSSMLLLATTKLPVGEVAAQVGYLNENYYSRIFKKIRGISPREYREIMTGKE